MVNTDYVPGYEIEEVLGIVWGSAIRAVHLGKDIKVAFKKLVGGELSDYTQMMEEARKAALDRLVEKARSMGADAVINLRFASSAVTTSAAEILAYGTAVKLRKK